MKLNANITGVKSLHKKFKKFGDEGQKTFENITKIQALEIALKAKRKAPIDNGKLRQGITVEEVNKTTFIIAALEKYSAFIEFGTGRKAKIPEGWELIASKFRGKSLGSFNDGLENIKAWAIKKGIDPAAAYPIFISILKNGIEPKPFLYPSFREGSERYLKDLNTAFNRLTRKYNK